MENFRPAAVPLITVDPYFTVWADGDHLYDDFTRHWTGKRQSLTGMIEVDGRVYRFLGKLFPDTNWYESEPAYLPQSSCQVGATVTTYEFSGHGIRLRAEFYTPLLPEDLSRLSTSVSFVRFSVCSADGIAHKVRLWFDISMEHCVEEDNQLVVMDRAEGPGWHGLTCGTLRQPVLERAGDLTRMDWGYLYLAAAQEEGGELFNGNIDSRRDYVWTREYHKQDYSGKLTHIHDRLPLLCAVTDLGEVMGEKHVSVILGYDDIHSIEYFGQPLDAYYRKDGTSFLKALQESVAERELLLKRCMTFDHRVWDDGVRAGGEKYAQMLSLAYRQAVAAHKLVYQPQMGEPGTAPDERWSGFRPEEAVLRPEYIRLRFLRAYTDLEAVPTLRGARLRLSFSGQEQPWLSVLPVHGKMSFHLDV